MKIGISAGKYIELTDGRASFHGMSREEAIELVEEALDCGSVNGKPLGEKRETLEWWLQKIYEQCEYDAKVQKIEAKIDEVLKNQPKQHKLWLKPFLRQFQYLQQGLSKDEEYSIMTQEQSEAIQKALDIARAAQEAYGEAVSDLDTAIDLFTTVERS